MRDYKDKVYRFEASRKALATRRSSSRNREVDFNFTEGWMQKAKLLAIAGVVLFLCYWYVRVQIKYEKDSVFYEIAQVFRKRSGEIGAKAPGITESNRSTASSFVDLDKADDKRIIHEQKVFLTRLEGKQNRVVLVPVIQKIDSEPEDFFRTLLQKLVQVKVSGLINAIPPGLQILSARVENEVLILDVNEQFETNRYGVAGIRAQIQQILWTIFESNQAKQNQIQAISFLIEGQRKSILGSDGVPLAPFYSKRHLRRSILSKEA